MELISYVFVQDAKVDVSKSEKTSAAAAGATAAKQNGFDIVSVTSDGCEISLVVSLRLGDPVVGLCGIYIVLARFM